VHGFDNTLTDLSFLIRTRFFGKTLCGTSTWASREKKPQYRWGSGWIAVLRLFRDIGWDKLGASSGGNY
jgi:hypothetical protein